MSETKQPMVSATLLLERPASIDAASLTSRLGKALNFTAKDLMFGDTGSGVAVIDGELVMTMHLDLPYPADLSNLAHFAHWWPTARQDIAQHRAHMMIMSAWSKHSRLDAHLRHLALIRGLIDELPVIGVLWGSVLTPGANFKGEFQAAMNGQLPVLVWVLIQYSRQPNGNSLISTLGMRDFGHMEIETESSLPIQESYDIVRSLATYVIAKNVRIPDGDTFGLSEQQRIEVRHRRSFRPDLNDPVLWLELAANPTVKRPSGFFSRILGSGLKQ